MFGRLTSSFLGGLLLSLSEEAAAVESTPDRSSLSLSSSSSAHDVYKKIASSPVRISIFRCLRRMQRQELSDFQTLLAVTVSRIDQGRFGEFRKPGPSLSLCLHTRVYVSCIRTNEHFGLLLSLSLSLCCFVGAHNAAT